MVEERAKITRKDKVKKYSGTSLIPRPPPAGLGMRLQWTPYSRLHELLTLQLISKRTCMMPNTYEPPSDLDPPVLPDPEQYKIHADACCRGRIGVLLPVNGHYITLLLIVQPYLASYSNREFLNVALSYQQSE